MRGEQFRALTALLAFFVLVMVVPAVMIVAVARTFAP